MVTPSLLSSESNEVNEILAFIFRMEPEEFAKLNYETKMEKVMALSEAAVVLRQKDLKTQIEESVSLRETLKGKQNKHKRNKLNAKIKELEEKLSLLEISHNEKL